MRNRLLIIVFAFLISSQIDAFDGRSEDCPSIVVSSQVINDIDNNGRGEIKLSISGGTPPYTIAWVAYNFSEKGEHIKNLKAGFYSVFIADANKCVKTYENIEVKNTHN